MVFSKVFLELFEVVLHKLLPVSWYLDADSFDPLPLFVLIDVPVSLLLLPLMELDGLLHIDVPHDPLYLILNEERIVFGHLLKGLIGYGGPEITGIDILLLLFGLFRVPELSLHQHPHRFELLTDVELSKQVLVAFDLGVAEVRGVVHLEVGVFDEESTQLQD